MIFRGGWKLEVVWSWVGVDMDLEESGSRDDVGCVPVE